MSRPNYIPDNPFSDADIDRIEDEMGYKLPRDYRDFVQKYGSTFVGGELDGSQDYGILHFFGIDNNVGMLTNEGEFEELREEGYLPIARCALNNIYVMDLDDGAIHYIDYYSAETNVEKVAKSFQEFVDRIVVADDDDEGEVDEEGEKEN